jgi:hypothetical protein
VPDPYGFAAAIDGVGTIASPLLAGISAALVVLVISSAPDFDWGDVAIFFLTGATLSLLAAVQCAFWARQYSVTPSELQEWWGPALQDAKRLEAVQDEQEALSKTYGKWSKRVRRYYNLGLLLLLIAIPVLLVPSGGLEKASDGRLMGFALAVIALMAELFWGTKVALARLGRWWRQE